MGTSPIMRQVRERIVKVARGEWPCAHPGESGTGKELVAKALHANGHRASGPWIAVNCSAIPESLLESEFLVRAKAPTPAPPRIAKATSRQPRGGTLFLDEIVATCRWPCNPNSCGAISGTQRTVVGSSQEERGRRIKKGQRRPQNLQQSAGGALPPGPVLPDQCR